MAQSLQQALIKVLHLSLLATVSGDLRSVRGWFERVGQLPACTKAVQKILPGKDLNALKNFLQKQPASHTQQNVPTEVYI